MVGAQEPKATQEVADYMVPKRHRIAEIAKNLPEESTRLLTRSMVRKACGGSVLSTRFKDPCEAGGTRNRK